MAINPGSSFITGSFFQYFLPEKKCPAKTSRASPLTIRNQDVYLY